MSPPESTTFPRASDHTNRHSQLSKHEGATLPAFARTLFTPSPRNKHCHSGITAVDPIARRRPIGGRPVSTSWIDLQLIGSSSSGVILSLSLASLDNDNLPVDLMRTHWERTCCASSTVSFASAYTKRKCLPSCRPVSVSGSSQAINCLIRLPYQLKINKGIDLDYLFRHK